jgi:pimeloyl-ACP methyl ester carboxylesterase
MHILSLALGWILGILFGLLALSMFLTGNRLQAILLLGIVCLLLPPVRNLIEQLIGRTIPGWVIAVLVVALLAVFVLLSTRNKPTSIYRTPEHEALLMEGYDARLEAWPVPYESRYVDTEYGQVHVIISGPEGAPPLLLLHASAVSGVSWLENVGVLNERYRTYAIDTIGDVGRSELADLTHFPGNGQALSDLVADVSGKLGVERAPVVGASQGGFIATSYALHAPERVDKVVLLGPMGYAGTSSSVARILLASLFPLKPIQEDTVRWSFGDDPAVLDAYGDWLLTVIDGVASKQARPTEFSSEQLGSLQVPVLLVLGARDNLVGDPEKAKELVQDAPNIQVEVIDTGHLLGVERPEEVNKLILDFVDSAQ